MATKKCSYPSYTCLVDEGESSCSDKYATAKVGAGSSRKYKFGREGFYKVIGMRSESIEPSDHIHPGSKSPSKEG